MTKERSLSLTALIAETIAARAPAVDYTPGDVKGARARYSDEKIAELKREGYLGEDFELFYVLCRFIEGLDLWGKADEDYLKALFSQARKMDRREFYRDPYLSAVNVPEKKLGDHLLMNAFYDRGEFFQYDMPDLAAEIVVPKLAFFPQRVAFPSVYEGQIPWVSVCPSEIASMTPDAAPARGKVLVLGLGLGYYPFLVSGKAEVESVTVIERDGEIIRLFETELLPQFPHRDKIRVVRSDAYDYLASLSGGEYDFCYADIWEGWTDGLPAYERIKREEARLPDTVFRYWIEKEILWWRDHGPRS